MRSMCKKENGVCSMTPSRPALKYYGGKWKLAPWIISFFPPHVNYLEPCGGAASVLLQKKPAKLETYNDIDGRIINFFKILRQKRDELIALIRLTPWSRQELMESKNISSDPVEDARRFFVSSWQAFSHGNYSWRCQINSTTRQRAPYRDMIDINHLLSIAKRLQKVQLENGNALDIIKKFDHKNTLIYFDPPYLASVRRHSKRYAFETDDNFHVEAADLLLKAKSMVIVSGYPCREYAELYESHGWIRHDKSATCNSGAKRTESIWLSPKTVKALNKPYQENLF